MPDPPNWLAVLKFQLLALLAALSVANGCSDSAESSGPPQVTADNRFGTAETLLEYYNSLTTQDPLDFRKFTSALYAENELQERLVRHYRAALPILDLSTAVRQRFDDALVEGSDNFTTKPNQRPARLVSSDEDRVEAVYTDSSGVEGPLHLVKIGERWWFSGYTLEYDPLEDLDPDALDKSDAYVDLYAAIAPDLLRRLNADEFSTIQEFWAALRNAKGSEVLKHPDRYETLFGNG